MVKLFTCLLAIITIYWNVILANSPRFTGRPVLYFILVLCCILQLLGIVLQFSFSSSLRSCCVSPLLGISNWPCHCFFFSLHRSFWSMTYWLPVIQSFLSSQTEISVKITILLKIAQLLADVCKLWTYIALNLLIHLQFCFGFSSSSFWITPSTLESETSSVISM